MATLSTLAPTLRNGTHGTLPTALADNHPRDPRYTSPNAVNGNPPPSHLPPPSKPQRYLPPLQPQSDPRSSAYPTPPPDQRVAYCNDRRPPYRQEAYSRDPYYAYCLGQPPPSRPPPPYVLLGYNYIAADVSGYPPIRHGSSLPLAQAAQRQRASIACNYCRKKKIRCSGSNDHPSGKCQNCARQNKECIFQPTLSSIFLVPVSAARGGVPLGAQVFVAYGQPLAPGTVPAPPPPYAAYQQSSAPPPLGNYYAPVQSPAESSSSRGEVKTDDGSQLAGRRRRRTSEEDDEGHRLRFSSKRTRQSSQNPTSDSLPQAATTGIYAASASRGRPPIGQNGSSGALTFGRQGQQFKGEETSIMSIGNLLNNSDETLTGPTNLGLANQADNEMSAHDGIANDN
ncbi:putative transcriptional regulatory protein TBS1 [Fusarium oxysporum f. sp. rapae]|uniref:Putative transcriptional regulatory protein TBS1 n=1 Tax=Fusarium oxysporum f. sp. rapae TaxID=485398 RepID=A0A8J5NYJ4_FUSOX|nr:putative transcriptional regulatory protein TBS1 [Fusarium oxysporum f. sp. rapae]